MSDFSLSSVIVKVQKTVTDIYDITIGRLLENLFTEKSTILFLGIDNAGKTTLVNRLKDNKNHIYMPTKHHKTDVIHIGKLKAAIVDMGGHRAARIAWRSYFYKIDGVIFIVDSYESARFPEVKESWELVKSLAGDIVPIVVLMNKIDKLGEDIKSIKEKPSLQSQIEEQVGITREDNININYLSILYENTYSEDSVIFKAFSWLNDQIKKNRNKNKK